MNPEKLNKKERFIAEMTWGGVPTDVHFVRNSALFNQKSKEFDSFKHFWFENLDKLKKQDELKQQVVKIVRQSITRHLVQHVQVPNDKRDRIDILLDEVSENIIQILEK